MNLCTREPIATNLPADDGASPFRRPLTISRRSMLAGLLGIGVGAFLDTSPLTWGTAWATTPKADPPKLTAGSLPTPPTPYAITATSELSDDTFATSEVLIGAGDKIMPFVNTFNDNLVEAIVLASGSVNHLYRDPSAPSGWAYEAVSLPDYHTIIDAAVAASPQGVYVLLFGNGVGSTVAPYRLLWLTDATSWSQASTPVNDPDYPLDPGPLKGGVSPSGDPFFYTAVSGGSTTTLQGWLTTGKNPALWPVSFLEVDYGGVDDYTVIFDNSGSNATNGFAFTLTSGALRMYQQQGNSFNPDPVTWDALLHSQQIVALPWVWTAPGNTSGKPTRGVYQAAVQNQSYQATYVIDGSSPPLLLADTPSADANAVTVWSQDDLYAVNVLDKSGVLHSILELAPLSWAAPLPLTNGAPGSVQPGLQSVYGISTDPAQSTLFAVGLDESLNVLSLDSVGWTQTQVRQSNVVAEQLTCYRLKINVTDANGVPVRYGQAQLSTDRPVALWQDLGSSVLVPGNAITLTADISGEIDVSVPAEELDVAVLTVQALDSSGNPSGTSLSVSSDYDVRNFLGGSAALNSLGTMSGSTLLAAQNPDGGVLFPGLSSSSADSLAHGLSGAITAGAGPTTAPAAADIKAYRLALDGKKVTLSTSKDADAYRTKGAKVEVGVSIGHVFSTIGHALRHAVAKVVSAVIHWADDIGQWVVDLATTISDLATYAINDMRDAFHVIGGWFTTLGADIVAAVNWLKRMIFGFLSSVGQNATTIGGVLTAGVSDLTGIVNGIEKQADGWFATQEATVTGWLTELESAVEQAEFGSTQPLSTPASDTGSASAMNGLDKDIQWIAKIVNDTPGKWLYDKLMQYLPGGDPGPQFAGAFDTVFQDLVTAFDDFIDMGADIANTWWDALKDLTTRGAMSQTEVTQWFSDINAVVQRGLQMCDALADTVFDLVKAVLGILSDYLSYQWSLVSINPILKFILDELGHDPTISLNRLVSLVTAFPLTIVREAKGLAPVFSTDQATASADTGDSFCFTAATITQFLWTFADIIGDVQLVVVEGQTSRPQQSTAIDYFDIICPILETVLTLPGRSNNLIFNGLPTNTNLPGLVPPSVFTALCPPAIRIIQKQSPNATSNPNVIPYYSDAPAQPNPLAQYYAPVLTTLAATANTILAAWYAYQNATNTGSKVAAILGPVLSNASDITAPLTTYWLNKSTENVPLIVKSLIDAIAGFGAGGITAASI